MRGFLQCCPFSAARFAARWPLAGCGRCVSWGCAFWPPLRSLRPSARLLALHWPRAFWVSCYVPALGLFCVLGRLRPPLMWLGRRGFPCGPLGVLRRVDPFLSSRPIARSGSRAVFVVAPVALAVGWCCPGLAFSCPLRSPRAPLWRFCLSGAASWAGGRCMGLLRPIGQPTPCCPFWARASLGCWSALPPVVLRCSRPSCCRGLLALSRPAVFRRPGCLPGRFWAPRASGLACCPVGLRCPISRASSVSCAGLVWGRCLGPSILIPRRGGPSHVAGDLLACAGCLVLPGSPALSALPCYALRLPLAFPRPFCARRRSRRCATPALHRLWRLPAASRASVPCWLSRQVLPWGEAGR